jgi:ketosteroid isomerase-like protein
MTKARFAPLVLMLSALIVSACAPKVNDPADVQAVTQTVEAFAKAMNAGDADGLVAMMTDKTIYADNHFPVAVGKTAVQPMYAAQFSQFNAEFEAPVDEVRVAGDMAVSRGNWKIKLTPKAAGLAPITDSGSWMALSSRQADGSWKWEWLVPNSNQPLPGGTADGADERAIAQIEQDWAAAMVKGDLAALERGLAKEWTLTEDGQTTTRAQALAAFKSGAYKVESATVRDLRVFVFGDAAIATMVVETKGTFMGKPVPPSSRSTDFFVKRDGQWQAVSTQNTAIK